MRNKQLPKEVSSKKERRTREHAQVKDPRFTSKLFNPLKHVENYSFLYDRERQQLKEQKEKGLDTKQQEIRMQARERVIKIKEQERERKMLELELVKQGKKPYYLSDKQKKILQAIETAKEKGVDHVVSKIKKKERERENKSRAIIGE